jgi:signal transduction histidine kinase
VWHYGRGVSTPTVDSDRTTAAFRPRIWHVLAAGPIAGVLSGTLAYWLQNWIDPAMASRPLGAYRNVVAFNVLAWTTWLLSVPAVWWFAGRVRITRQRLVSATAVHLAISVLMALVICLAIAAEKHLVFAAVGITRFGGLPLTYGLLVKESLLVTFEWKVLLYWGVVGVHHAMLYAGEARQRELREARIRQHLVEAQLDALQRQLQPHFLFNTLHAIGSIVHRDADAAESMLMRLGDLLRAVSRSQARHEVTLARELELLQEYVDLQQLRFGPTLRVVIDVAGDAGDGLVPVLVLQPLVENAIKHGMANRAGGGLVRVSARRDGGRLHLAVADDGSSTAPQTAPLHEGVGLGNTRARLEHLYPGQHRITVSAPPDGGFVVTLSLPWQVLRSSDPVLLAATAGR